MWQFKKNITGCVGSKPCERPNATIEKSAATAGKGSHDYHYSQLGFSTREHLATSWVLLQKFLCVFVCVFVY